MFKIYTTETCPRCLVLKKKLQAKGIEFEETHELDEIIEMGFTNAPILFDGKNYLEFGQAIAVINGMN